jgi:hypothetical protein
LTDLLCIGLGMPDQLGGIHRRLLADEGRAVGDEGDLVDRLPVMRAVAMTVGRIHPFPHEHA